MNYLNVALGFGSCLYEGSCFYSDVFYPSESEPSQRKIRLTLTGILVVSKATSVALNLLYIFKSNSQNEDQVKLKEKLKKISFYLILSDGSIICNKMAINYLESGKLFFDTNGNIPFDLHFQLPQLILNLENLTCSTQRPFTKIVSTASKVYGSRDFLYSLSRILIRPSIRNYTYDLYNQSLKRINNFWESKNHKPDLPPHEVEKIPDSDTILEEEELETELSTDEMEKSDFLLTEESIDTKELKHFANGANSVTEESFEFKELDHLVFNDKYEDIPAKFAENEVFTLFNCAFTHKALRYPVVILNYECTQPMKLPMQLFERKVILENLRKPETSVYPNTDQKIKACQIKEFLPARCIIEAEMFKLKILKK